MIKRLPHSPDLVGLHAEHNPRMPIDTDGETNAAPRPVRFRFKSFHSQDVVIGREWDGVTEDDTDTKLRLPYEVRRTGNGTDVAESPSNKYTYAGEPNGERVYDSGGSDEERQRIYPKLVTNYELLAVRVPGAPDVTDTSNNPVPYEIVSPLLWQEVLD